jgi:hypothetical protein
MLKIKIDKEYQVPTSWQDVTFEKFIDWLNFMPKETDVKTEVEILSFTTGIEQATLEQCSIDTLNTLSGLMMFWFDFETLDAYNVVDKKFSDAIDFNKLPFGKLELLQQKIKECESKGLHPFSVALDCFKIYFEPMRFEKVNTAYGYANLLFEKAVYHFKWSPHLQRINDKKIYKIKGMVDFFLQNWDSSLSSSHFQTKSTTT